jgi:hypothetical protein
MHILFIFSTSLFTHSFHRLFLHKFIHSHVPFLSYFILVLVARFNFTSVLLKRIFLQYMRPYLHTRPQFCEVAAYPTGPFKISFASSPHCLPYCPLSHADKTYIIIIIITSHVICLLVIMIFLQYSLVSALAFLCNYSYSRVLGT